MGGSVAILPGVRNLEWSRSQNVAHGRVDDVRFRSIQLRNERTARVYLPAGFDQADQYDLLVMMDEDVYSGPVPLATILDNLIAQRKAMPMIIVMPNNVTGTPAPGVARAADAPPPPATGCPFTGSRAPRLTTSTMAPARTPSNTTAPASATQAGATTRRLGRRLRSGRMEVNGVPGGLKASDGAPATARGFGV